MWVTMMGIRRAPCAKLSAWPCRQVILGAITGEGGILFYISKGITEGVLGDVTDVTFTSPTKFIVSPLTAPWFRFIQCLENISFLSVPFYTIKEPKTPF